jgi:hypothetical protein
MLTAERLREVLSYDPETGVFVWLKRTARRIRVGDVAGCLGTLGYRSLGINGEEHLAHRLAWLYVHGEWPSADIDHINGDPGDNRLANLRPATRAQNSANAGKRTTNTSGLKGVCWSKKSCKWRAAITVNGQVIYLGLFDCPAEAHAAYARAAEQHCGEFARVA